MTATALAPVSSAASAACAGLLGLAASLPAQAALFGDDEARKAILELRAKVDANRQAGDNALAELRRKGQNVNDGASGGLFHNSCHGAA